MSDVSIDELTTPITVAEAKTAIYDAIAAQGTDHTLWKPFAIVRILVTALAIIVAAFSRLQAAIAASGFLDRAEGAWLTLLARHVYGVERRTAEPAAGVVTLENTGGGVYELDPGDLIVATPVELGGVQYRNTQAISLGALETLEDVPVEAIETGSAGTTGADTITVLVTTLLSVLVTNPSALTGLDEMTDPELRDLCRAKLGSLSPNGPRDAYRYQAVIATRDDGSSLGVNRVTTDHDEAGTVTCTVATASGALSGDPEDPDTDLGVLADWLERTVVPIGITLDLQSATPDPQTLVVNVWVYDDIGLDESEIEDSSEESVTDLFAEAPIGGHVISPDPGKVFRGSIATRIATDLTELSGVTDAVFRVEVPTPASDIELDPDGIPTVTTVTTNVTFVARA